MLALLAHGGLAEHFVQGQHGVVRRMIGVMAGRPIKRRALVVEDGQIIGDGNKPLCVTRKPYCGPAVGVQLRTRVLAQEL